jgi:hypothetical protein
MTICLIEFGKAERKTQPTLLASFKAFGDSISNLSEKQFSSKSYGYLQQFSPSSTVLVLSNDEI